MKNSFKSITSWTKSPSILDKTVKAVRTKAPFLLGSVLLLFVAFDSQALILCRLGKEVRTLRAESGPASCKAIYTKQGVDSQIGASTMSADACEGIITGVKKNLEAGGWKCKIAKEAKVSNLNSEVGAQ